MTIFEAIISGIVQGVTEFLPISSSGHLVLLHHFLGLSKPSIFFDICLHVGTLGAVMIYFRKEIFLIIRERDLFMISCLVIGTIPAIIAAFLFKEHIELLFARPRVVAVMFIVTALVLFGGQYCLRTRNKKLKVKRGGSFFVGLAQAVALLPGVSRSGTTISAALALGVEPETAFRFSFLLAIPAIIGAACYQALNIGPSDILPAEIPEYAAGTIAAFFVGLMVLPFLLKVIRSRRLYVFGVYCLLSGVSLLLWI
ncbi:MAG: undecaprenyl-diphosphate phosphatase [Candidatus Omnitrophica bacterium]|nr:undecaprenyl-diphosphate phosphatase [Candidatus Omnitrophota bacterium]MBU1128835.1 undecaprenyl-diphosphate phosphatase [Candidatus Omnitrophota bacterium]MBU1783772.1 undecaprenyl-diphosphate phosphatase [Candidatus Omnitrophota bacterium]MBU1852135.1 undecaprenyl-diphosphate phosphatase [Candidatus Omnitrophota bacterium]